MKKPITTTLRKIKERSLCKDKVEKLCKELGGIDNYGENTPIRFSQIVKINGLDYAIRCLCTVYSEHEREIRHFSADCTESVLPFFEEKYPENDNLRKAVQAARDSADGLISAEELEDARHADAVVLKILRSIRSARDAAGAKEKKKQEEMFIKRFG